MTPRCHCIVRVDLIERLQQEIALLERVRARKMLAARDVEVLDSMLESRRTLLYQLRQQSRAPERVQGG